MSDMFGDFLEDPDDQIFDDEAGGGGSEVATVESSERLLPPNLMTRIVGHDDVEESLLEWHNSGRFPHALIFSGIKGIGKATMAYRLARFLLKEGEEDNGGVSLFGDAPMAATSFDVPAEDKVFRRVASRGHPDMMVVERRFDEKKNKLANGLEVDQIRKVAPFIRMTASAGKWRVVLIDDADTMNRNSQNAILKILEEPPENSVIILVCHNLGAMIPTIRSRCRVVNFQPLADDTVMHLLTEDGLDGVSRDDMSMVANLSEGSVGRAQEYSLDENLATLQILADIVNCWPPRGGRFDRLQIFKLSEMVSQSGKGHAFLTFWQNLNFVLNEMTRARVLGALNLRPPYKCGDLLRVVQDYSLENWIEICDNTKEHFIVADRGNLDKRQTTLDAFRAIEKCL